MGVTSFQCLLTLTSALVAFPPPATRTSTESSHEPNLIHQQTRISRHSVVTCLIASSDRKEHTVNVYVKLGCILCMWVLWKTTANMAFCYLLWITTLALVVRYIVRAKVKGGFLILLGITSNAFVTLLN